MPVTTLLVVDDNRADSDYIKTLLDEVAPNKFKVYTASTFAETLEVITLREVDIITLDLYLPDSQGLGTLLAIRAKVPTVPVVVVSGLDDTKITKESLFYGAQSYLVKGDFDGNKLLDAMTQAMAKQSQATFDNLVKRMQRDLAWSQEIFKKPE